MSIDLTEYFRYLDLVREDIREEVNLLEIGHGSLRICDFGCGSGITTFGLALESRASECIGLDLFGEETGIKPVEFRKLIESIAALCEKGEFLYSELCRLINTGKTPKFLEGNIVENLNMPTSIDLAYCKKLLVNIHGKHYAGSGSGEQNVISGIENIARSLCPGGLVCAVEYDRDYLLEEYFEKCGFQVLKRCQIERREIRKRGRTDAVSIFTLYLCQKPAKG